MKRGGKRGRLVGAGVAGGEGGGALGAPGGRCDAVGPQGGGGGTLASPRVAAVMRWRSRARAMQASPPTASATPAPTGTKELPKRHDKIPTRESTLPWGTHRTRGERARSQAECQSNRYHDEGAGERRLGRHQEDDAQQQGGYGL